ncbi:MAG: (Fe-S)-binding protein [Sphaerochaetaceae bacterium]|nr:(Fe-S)-binding protein [Sphaerochaetaceae bacterium]
MALKDYAKEIERCSACSYCKWIPFDHVKSWRFAKNCPSIDYFNFNNYSARGRYLTSRSILREEIEITQEVVDIAHTCLTCGACDVACKISRYNLEPLEMVRELKAELVKQNRFPEAHGQILQNLTHEANVFGKDRHRRGDWAEGLNIKDLTRETSGIVFHAGCSYSFDESLTPTVRTAVEIMNASGVDYGIMGAAEMCCGARSHAMGQDEAFTKLAKANIKLWKRAGVKTIVTACADGYHAFKHLYPSLGGDFEVIHIVEFIDRLIREQRLTFTKEIPLQVTYHDPCHLGRMGEPYEPWEGEEKKFKNQIVVHEPRKPRKNGIHGIYDEPRHILESIPGINLVEMERIREFSYCCGAGGGAPEAYPEYSSWVARERMEEAKATGSQALVTACPWCRTSFTSASRDEDSMQIVDILDLVRKAL